MLQNRVNPFGRIIETPARGAWMGNRGIIHNERKQIVRPFKHKAWITCVLEFKGRARIVMTPNRWTELFFLDEATAFAAGHRPCFECRREAAKHFKMCWIEGNPDYGFNITTSIQQIDEILHHERIDGLNQKITYAHVPADLPEGTFVAAGEYAYLYSTGKFYRWSPFGYDGDTVVKELFPLVILTPKSIVNAFAAGYMPQFTVPSFNPI